MGVGAGLTTSSFNPCSNGLMVSIFKESMKDVYTSSGFNPCSNGLMVSIKIKKYTSVWIIFVSILVLMD